MNKHPQTHVVTGLVLAAGYSRRFGGDKRWAVIGDGTTLLNTCLTLACSALDEVWLVLRPDDLPSEFGLESGVRVVQDSVTAQGMGYSIATGVRHIAHSSHADCLAIFLADMPHIRRSSLEALLALASPSRIVVPTYVGTQGHPVLFGREFWPYLFELDGDQGAKCVLNRFPGAIDLLETNDPGVLRDIDSTQDLEIVARL